MKPEKPIADFFQRYRDRVMAETLNQRLAIIRRVKKERNYLKGESSDWWDGVSGTWRAFEESADYNEDEAPRYNFNLNLYQAGWQILQAAIQTTGIPGSTFIEQNPQEVADQQAVKLADPIIQYERSVIDYGRLWLKVFRYFYTDGIAVLYMRNVRDAGRFGSMSVRREVEQEVIARPAGYECFNCRNFTPAGMSRRDELGRPTCPFCGTPFHAENFIDVERQIVRKPVEEQIARSKEMVDIFGALECPLPWWPSDLERCPYIPIITEVQREQLLQAFPDSEQDIMGASEGSYLEGTFARQSVRAPLGSSWEPRLEMFVTYGRWWFRPECFLWETDETTRPQLLEQFEHGAFVQFAGDAVLDAIDERVEDHIEISRAFEGDGMYTPSIGQNGVPIHESTNTAWNNQIEAQEVAGFPPVLLDDAIISAEGVKSTKARPGEYKSITVPAGKTLAGSWAQITVKESSQAGQQLLDSARQWQEYVQGTSPALAGAALRNARSAEQYEIAKNQALQRLAPPYENAKRSFSRLDEMLVHEFLRMRSAEEIRAVVGSLARSAAQQTALLAPSAGRLFARSEQSDAIPQTWAQQQSSINQMLNSQNPIVQGWLADPNNAEIVFRAKGIPAFVVAGKAQFEKMRDLIPQLLEQTMVQNPETGLLEPSQPFDPILDDPKVVLRVIQEWAAGREGVEAKTLKPDGFKNIRMFAEQAAQHLQALQMQAQPQPQPSR